MKNLFVTMFIGVLSMMAFSVNAQEEITLVNVNPDLGFPTKTITMDEIDALISTPIIDELGETLPTIADSLDVVMLLDFFNDYGLADACDGFWYQSAERYLEAPEKAAEFDELGEYYNPQSVIYVPDSEDINAIMFDWSSDFLIAIVRNDGLWVLYQPEELDEDWLIYIHNFYQFIIDNNW